LVQAPLGIASEFHAEATVDARASELLAALGGHPFLLHVGSCIPRKRIDVLLEVFARLRNRFPDLKLVKVGGVWMAEQARLLHEQRIADEVLHVPTAERRTLAVLYRRAAAVLLPSDAEGFGLPVVEALACGSPVIISDLPVLREVGGDAAVYCPAGDGAAWSDTVERLLGAPCLAPAVDIRLQQARRFSWQRHAQIIADSYLRLLA
jgi:glycosyltransferase involved in cell wall biosynthesis